MAHIPVFICEMPTPEGSRQYVTCLSPEFVTAHGLIHQAIIGQINPPLAANDSITPERFTPNSAFIDFMHKSIARKAPQIPSFIDFAQKQGTGLIFVIDLRKPDPTGGVPPQDLVGIFPVQGGKISSETYKPSPNHQLLTDSGFFQLMPLLHITLLEELTTLAKANRI